MLGPVVPQRYLVADVHTPGLWAGLDRAQWVGGWVECGSLHGSAALHPSAHASIDPNMPHLHAVVLRVALRRLQLLGIQVEHPVRALHLLGPVACDHRRPPRLQGGMAGWEAVSHINGQAAVGVWLGKTWTSARSGCSRQQTTTDAEAHACRPLSCCLRASPPPLFAAPAALAPLTVGFRREGGSTCSVTSQNGSARRALQQGGSSGRKIKPPRQQHGAQVHARCLGVQSSMV